MRVEVWESLPAPRAPVELLYCRACVSPTVARASLPLKRAFVQVRMLFCWHKIVLHKLICHIVDCHTSCRTCSGTSIIDCSTCPLNRMLRGGRCISACPDGEYDRRGTCQCI